MSSSPTEQPGAHPGTDPAAPESQTQEAAGGDVIQILMPQMGVSVAEGTIVEWRKQPGDWVEADEPVCDVTTDKVDVEIPSPASGRLERILVKPGDTVPVGTLLAEIDAAARPGEAHPAEHHEPKPGPPQPVAGAGGRRRRPAATPEPAPAAANGEADRSGFHSPVVRRIAGKHRIDLSRVQGTGIGGRVRKKDVLAYLESHEGAPREAAPEPALHTESPTNARRRRRPPRRARPRPRELRLHRRQAPRPRDESRSWRRAGASRCRRCARRLPATWSGAVARRLTARRSSRPTSRGSPRTGGSSASKCGAAASTSPTWRSWPGRP